MKKNDSEPKDLVGESLLLSMNSFSTILLDAIQFFPENIKKTQSEVHGLLFGIEQRRIVECDYVFPVGNVKTRKEDEIRIDPKIDQAIYNAKHLISTSKIIGSYHSHPNDDQFNGWACPSNADVNYYNASVDKYAIIIGIKRNSSIQKDLELHFNICQGKKYYYDQKFELDEPPKEVAIPLEFQYITGKFRKYEFEVRAYRVLPNCLQDINLLSSEVDMLIKIITENIDISDTSPEMAYGLKKVEYDYRSLILNGEKNNDRVLQNIEYHVGKIEDQLKTKKTS